jgi:hypothetical protein
MMLAAIAEARIPAADLHARFAPVIPAVATAGETMFHDLSPEDRDDAVADATLSAWERFLRAVTERVAVDPSDLARRAVAAVARRLDANRRRHPLLPA